jgi:hypothetical protein
VVFSIFLCFHFCSTIGESGGKGQGKEDQIGIGREGKGKGRGYGVGNLRCLFLPCVFFSV